MIPNQSGRAKVLLSTLNAKYIHSSLALRYLRTFCQDQGGFEINIKEFTINQPLAEIMGEVYLDLPDILGFSCYIWNIDAILNLCADYKKVAHHTLIVLGGPEVSYTAEQVLLEHPCLDCVVRGEGEETLLGLLQAIQAEQPWDAVPGISFRQADQIINNPDRDSITELDRIPFPYQLEMGRLADKVVYYESSRGCPFQCSYCLSSASRGIRYFSLDRVKADLAYLLSHPVREIKFVDRTFNCDEKRMREIIDFIAAHRGASKIHFEIDAGLFSEGMLEYLETVPEQLFNFEIGIQSTHPPTLAAVRRRQDWPRLSNNILRLQQVGNFHLHLDLIAGLPGEDYAAFTRSFNMVYALQPDKLQLGFLKLLKGSDLHRLSSKYGYMYQVQAPYQVLANQVLTYPEILALTRIEDIVEKYYNSGDMRRTLAYIVPAIYPDQALQFFGDLSEYWQSQQLFGLGHKKEAYYGYLLAFIASQYPDHLGTVYELLKYDYICRNHRYGLPPEWSSLNPDDINEQTYAYAQDANFINRNLGKFAGKTAREIKKHIHIEYFQVDPHTFQKSDGHLRIMFVYDPLTRAIDRIIDLDACCQD
ncbi:MAG: DUF4080 domain-containing protein [Firmicutes bacterium]|nr:DUF4080 domain-containing protein [Bacillota bacterium]